MNDQILGMSVERLLLDPSGGWIALFNTLSHIPSKTSAKQEAFGSRIHRSAADNGLDNPSAMAGEFHG